MIAATNPRVVVTLGATALKSAMLIDQDGAVPSRKELRLASSVGRLHDWQGRKLLPLYHPGRRAQITRTKSQQLADIRVLRDYLRSAPL